MATNCLGSIRMWDSDLPPCHSGVTGEGSLSPNPQ